jgi:hypothetical protein
VNIQIPPVVNEHIECLCTGCETRAFSEKKVRVLKKTIIMGLFLSSCLAFCLYHHSSRVLALERMSSDISWLELAKKVSIVILGYFVVGTNLTLVGNILNHAISVVMEPKETPEFISYFTIL